MTTLEVYILGGKVPVLMRTYKTREEAVNAGLAAIDHASNLVFRIF